MDKEINNFFLLMTKISGGVNKDIIIGHQIFPWLSHVIASGLPIWDNSLGQIKIGNLQFKQNIGLDLFVTSYFLQ